MGQVTSLSDRADSRREIIRGLAQYQENERRRERIYEMAQRDTAAWDPDWGGECPWRAPDPEMEELRRKCHLMPIQKAHKGTLVDKYYIPICLICLALMWAAVAAVDAFM